MPLVYASRDVQIYRKWVLRTALRLSLLIGALSIPEQFAIGQQLEPVMQTVWMQRLNAMMQKLMNRKPITIVALGDSITFGTGLRDAISDNYVTLFARALSEAFGNAPVRPFRVADPGCRIHEAVAFISTHVTPLHPDLVIIQLGGNDVAMRTDGYVVEQALLNILDMLKRDTNAVVMLLLPPLEDKPRDHTLSRILRAVAVMQKLLFVDWDTILRQVGYDYRGPFAWGAHPNEYAHVIVAKALWKAFWEALAQPPQLTVEIAHQVQYVNAGSEVLIPIVVSNAGDQAIECEVIASIGTAPHSTHRAKLQLDARASHEVMLKWQLPTKLPRQRSYRVPLWTSVRNERDANFDAKWITVCPVLRCSTQPLPLLSPTTDLQRRMDDATPAMGAAEGGAKQLTRRQPMPDELVRPQPHIRLTPKHAVLGWRTLNDLRDLEAIISAHRDKERIHILVQVRDDVVVADAMRKYTENDCIELFLDVRPTARQGIPYYERSVIVLFINPPSAPNGKVKYGTLDPAPRGFNRVEVVGARTVYGYAVRISLPIALLHEWAGEPVSRIGFDVAIDDADSYHGRDAQLIWAGVRENFIYPRLFGALSWSKDDTPETVRVTIH